MRSTVLLAAVFVWWNSSEGIGGYGAPNSGFPTLSTVQLEGLVIGLPNGVGQYMGTYVYPDIRFSCDGNITKWIVLTGGKGTTQLQIWDKADNDGVTYNLTNTSSGTVHATHRGYHSSSASPPIPFKKGSILGLYQPWVFVNGGLRSYRAEYPGMTTINISAAADDWDYPLVGVETSPPNCSTGFLSGEMLNIISAGIHPSTCTCMSTGTDDHTSFCNFSQCTNITNFYIGVTPTPLQGNVLQLHVMYYNNSDNVTLVINGTASAYPFVYEFTPERPLLTTAYTFLLQLVDENQLAVDFVALYDGYPLVAIQAQGNCCQGNLRRVYSTIVYSAASMYWYVPSDNSMCQHCILPNMTFTFTGAVTKWTFAAYQNTLMSTTMDITYPHFELWRKVSDNNYTRLQTTAELVPVLAGFPNIYEYRLGTPWSFQRGDVLGLQLPPPGAPRLAFILNNADLTYCSSDNFKNCSNHALVPMVTPKVIYNVSTSATPVEATVTVIDVVPPGSTVASLTSSLIPTPSTSLIPTPSITFPYSTPSNNPLNNEAVTNSPTYSVSGLIAGLVVVAILVVVLLAGITACVVHKKRSPKQYEELTQGLVLHNVVYNGVAHHRHDATDNPVYNDSYGVGAHRAVPQVDYAVISNTGNSSSSLHVYHQFDESAMNSGLNTNPPTITQEQNGGLYWEPSSTSEQLYEQLSQYQYNQIPRASITVLEHLGSGEFGTVSKGMWRAPNGVMEVALKTLREGAEERDRVRFLREAAIMGQFHHPNVVKLYGVVTVGNPLMIVLELMRDGDLRQLLIDKRQGSSLDPHLPQLCLSFCCQIASGMVCLSKKAFVHRDLAARNVLVCNGDTCKIADFGMSRDLQDEDYYRSHGGKIPVKWTAPEALHYKTYSTASDVWSFGCVMYEIWSLGRKPFEGETNQEVLRLIDSGYRLPPPPGCPKAIYGLMMQCWNPDKSLRPTFEVVLHTLCGPKDQLLQWEREGAQTHPQSSLLGAPLDCGRGLYPSLQGMYL